jgi:hypothetical protein
MIRAWLLLSLLFGFLALSTFTAAQHDNGWPIEQRCVGEPTMPPEDWTFEGTILMTGYAGIHAVQADWETPRVVVFLDEERNLRGGTLSPDGNWYASPYGDVYETETHNFITTVEEIRIYSTVEAQEEYSVALPDTPFFGGTYGKAHWLDNSHFIFETGITPHIVEINPFTGEMSTWDGAISDLSGNNGSHPYPSPDFTRYLTFGSVYDVATGGRLQDIPIYLGSRIPVIVWKPDSTHFVAEIQGDEINAKHALGLFDRDGNLVSSIFNFTNDKQIRRALDRSSVLEDIPWENIAWSLHGRYVAFIVQEQPYPLVTNLYIADIEQRRVIDTCISTDAGLAWSPKGTQLALMAEGEGQRPILVYDIQQNQILNVGYHSGGILAWRAND